MEKLPLTFVQATVDPDIRECFDPAFNFTKINSSNGRLAFTEGKLYWLPEAPIALMDQGWVIAYSEIESYGKFGLAGFTIKLVDGSELRFSNVGKKMREGIEEAIEAHKNDAVPEAAAAPAAEAAAAPEAATDGPAAPAAPDAEDDPDLADAKNNKLMGILAYLGILVLIPLFAAKESKFVRFHTNQGLILLILLVVVYILGKIPGISALVAILDVVLFVYAVIGIYNVVKGQMKELPLIGKFRIIQ